MVCDRCGMDTFDYKEVVQNGKTEHICFSCYYAEEKENLFHIGNFFEDDNTVPTSLVTEVTCTSCGSTFEDFKKSGLLGCGECYHVFMEKLLPILEQMQGSTHYMGKHLDIEQSLLEKKKEELQEAIRQSVLQEDYDKAAQLKRELDRVKEGE